MHFLLFSAKSLLSLLLEGLPYSYIAHIWSFILSHILSLTPYFNTNTNSLFGKDLPLPALVTISTSYVFMCHWVLAAAHGIFHCGTWAL